jgi:hypothetical protein
MLDKRNQTLQSLPVANYCPAIARQGDRYLLGKPVNAAPSRESHYHYPHLTDHHT